VEKVFSNSTIYYTVYVQSAGEDNYILYFFEVALNKKGLLLPFFKIANLLHGARSQSVVRD